MQTTLLASAGTIDGILAQVNAFYFSRNWEIDPSTLALYNPKIGKGAEGVRVVKKGKRYRFEMLTED